MQVGIGSPGGEAGRPWTRNAVVRNLYSSRCVEKLLIKTVDLFACTVRLLMSVYLLFLGPSQVESGSGSGSTVWVPVPGDPRDRNIAR